MTSTDIPPKPTDEYVNHRSIKRRYERRDHRRLFRALGPPHHTARTPTKQRTVRCYNAEHVRVVATALGLIPRRHSVRLRRKTRTAICMECDYEMRVYVLDGLHLECPGCDGRVTEHYGWDHK